MVHYFRGYILKRWGHPELGATEIRSLLAQYCSDKSIYVIPSSGPPQHHRDQAIQSYLGGDMPNTTKEKGINLPIRRADTKTSALFDTMPHLRPIVSERIPAHKPPIIPPKQNMETIVDQINVTVVLGT